MRQGCRLRLLVLRTSIEAPEPTCAVIWLVGSVAHLRVPVRIDLPECGIDGDANVSRVASNLGDSQVSAAMLFHWVMSAGCAFLIDSY
jgi:hypothetical protein